MKDNSIKKVLVIGSGPIVIGQAAEFDYAGVQACRALKEEGIEVVLVNSNPATIMTDEHIADKVYIEPLTVDILTKITPEKFKYYQYNPEEFIRKVCNLINQEKATTIIDGITYHKTDNFTQRIKK